MLSVLFEWLYVVVSHNIYTISLRINLSLILSFSISNFLSQFASHRILSLFFPPSLRVCDSCGGKRGLFEGVREEAEGRDGRGGDAQVSESMVIVLSVWTEIF